MSCGPVLDLCIIQGKTFQHRFFIGTGLKLYSQISAATAAAPCVITTGAAHGILDDQPYSITGAKGMKEINSPVDRSGVATPRLAKVLSTTTLELNDLNTANASAYIGGGYIERDEPKDLTGHTVAMMIREKVTDTDPLLSLTSSPAAGIAIDTTKSIITITITATQTAALTITTGVYDIELTHTGSGVIFALPRGTVSVTKEVTK